MELEQRFPPRVDRPKKSRRILTPGPGKYRRLSRPIRLREEDRGDPQLQTRHDMEGIARLRASPIAIETDKDNSQHYELPPRFFERVPGPQLKYSCCYFGHAREPLAQAQEQMLQLTAT